PRPCPLERPAAHAGRRRGAAGARRPRSVRRSRAVPGQAQRRTGRTATVPAARDGLHRLRASSALPSAGSDRRERRCEGARPLRGCCAGGSAVTRPGPESPRWAERVAERIESELAGIEEPLTECLDSLPDEAAAHAIRTSIDAVADASRRALDEAAAR